MMLGTTNIKFQAWILYKTLAHAKQIRQVNQLIVRLYYAAVAIMTPDMPLFTRDEME